jgi:large subunit ribosomal protein L13
MECCFWSRSALECVGVEGDTPVAGLKSQQKVYRRYTGYPGGLREESFTRLLQRRPEKIVEEAIKGMLPKTKMGRKMGSKLNVYRGDQHPHQAQKPQPLEVKA